MTTHERKINATKGIQGFHETPKTEPQNTALVAAEPDPYAGFSRQSAGPIKGLSLQVSARSARELSRMVEDESLMLDPPYQRGDVWSMDQRVNLVKSWISQTPIPAVIYNCRDRLTWKTDGSDWRQPALGSTASSEHPPPGSIPSTSRRPSRLATART
jgi:hypothetical protein